SIAADAGDCGHRKTVGLGVHAECSVFDRGQSELGADPDDAARVPLEVVDAAAEDAVAVPGEPAAIELAETDGRAGEPVGALKVLHHRPDGRVVQAQPREV